MRSSAWRRITRGAWTCNLCVFLQEGWTNVPGRGGHRARGVEARRARRRRRPALRHRRAGADRRIFALAQGIRRRRRHPPRRRLHDARHGYPSGLRSRRRDGLGRARGDRPRQQILVPADAGARGARTTAREIRRGGRGAADDGSLHQRAPSRAQRDPRHRRRECPDRTGRELRNLDQQRD